MNKLDKQQIEHSRQAAWDIWKSGYFSNDRGIIRVLHDHIEAIEREKNELQLRLTNLRCYLQGPLSMGGGVLEKIEEASK